MKEIYERTALTVTSFAQEDVIITSTPDTIPDNNTGGQIGGSDNPIPIKM